MRESAKQRKAHQSKGNVVSMILRNGETLSAPTAAHAQQWGDLALLTLRNVPELWTIGAMDPVA